MPAVDLLCCHDQAVRLFTGDRSPKRALPVRDPRREAESFATDATSDVVTSVTDATVEVTVSVTGSAIGSGAASASEVPPVSGFVTLGKRTTALPLPFTSAGFRAAIFAN